MFGVVCKGGIVLSIAYHCPFISLSCSKMCYFYLDFANGFYVADYGWAIAVVWAGSVLAVEANLG